MRLIKLSLEEFPETKNVVKKFCPNKAIKFRLTKTKSSYDYSKGEVLIISYNRNIKYLTMLTTGKLLNRDKHKRKYPCYFNLKVLQKIENKFLKDIAHIVKTRGQGWNIIQDKIELRILEVLESTHIFENFKNEDFGGSYDATVILRKLQNKFRQIMLRKFESKCVISDCGVEKALEATHVYNFAKVGKHNEDNGLLLRADLHRLFDAKLIGINPFTKTVILKKEIAQNPFYKKYNKKELKIEINEVLLENLKMKWKNFKN